MANLQAQKQPKEAKNLREELEAAFSVFYFEMAKEKAPSPEKAQAILRMLYHTVKYRPFGASTSGNMAPSKAYLGAIQQVSPECNARFSEFRKWVLKNPELTRLAKDMAIDRSFDYSNIRDRDKFLIKLWKIKIPRVALTKRGKAKLKAKIARDESLIDRRNLEKETLRKSAYETVLAGNYTLGLIGTQKEWVSPETGHAEGNAFMKPAQHQADTTAVKTSRKPPRTRIMPQRKPPEAQDAPK